MTMTTAIQSLSPLMPRQAVPHLQVPTLAHVSFTLSEDAAPHFTLLVFYRGLHCPICLKHLARHHFHRHRRTGPVLRARRVHRAA